MAKVYWLSETEWARLEPLMPRGRRGARRVDDRRIISGIVHMLRCGARRRDCPAVYGPYTTVYNRFNRWSRQGLWLEIFETLTGQSPIHGLAMIDSNINDISIARALLQRAGPVSRLVADRGYDANHLRRFLADQQAEAVIPSTSSRRRPIPYDTIAYRDRNRIERMWCRLKDWRRTRYDKLARNFLSSAYLAAIFSCWIN